MYICETPPRKDHPVHGSDLQKIIDLIARHALGTPVKLGCFDEAASSSGGDAPAATEKERSDLPHAKRAKTEPEAGVAVKPFDQRPSRFKSDNLTEVPLPNGLVMLFSTENHVLLYNPQPSSTLKLEGGTVLCGFQKGNWFKEASYTCENPLNPARDILYELKDACSTTVASGSRWAAQTTTIGVQVQEAQNNNAAAKVLYYNMVQKPTAANPDYFELEISHKMYWQVLPTTVPKIEPQSGGSPPSKVSHDHAGGLLPAHAWQMDHEGRTARHTKLAFVVRYNKQRHGLVPVRPQVILCNGITLKPSEYTMLIGSDESDA